MINNYYKLGCEQLINLTNRKKLLLHSCCAPCSSSVIEYLSSYFNITIFYYNPNISPKEEYLKRKEEQINFIKKLDNIQFLDYDYDNDKYNSLIIGLENEKEGGKRCQICYKMRLDKTAEIASYYGFDYFCTTLSVSPYKNATLINNIGKELEKQYNVRWLYSDFKKNNGYKRSIELSKKYNLYRQNYCGCIYSKR